MAILVDSKTDKSVKNKWATNWHCFLDAKREFLNLTGKNLILDVAAEPQTAKVNRYYLSPDWISEQQNLLDTLKPKHPIAKALNPVCVGFDGLQCDWEDGWWCNPPFDFKQEFIKKAVDQMAKGCDGIMLLPYEPLTNWWKDLVEPYAKMVLEPTGRYPFYEADGETKKTGVNFGSVLVLFTLKNIQLPRWRITRGKYSEQEILDSLTSKPVIIDSDDYELTACHQGSKALGGELRQLVKMID